MLILTRRFGEAVIVGDNIEIIVLRAQANGVRLGINAPKDIPVHREEIYLRIKDQKNSE